MSEKSPYKIKQMPLTGNYAVIDAQTGEILRPAKTAHDAINIKANMEANLPSDEVGFGQWGIPNFLRKIG